MRFKGGRTLRYFNDIYEKIYYQLFCVDLEDFRMKTGRTLFSDGLDCKEYLEEYFNIKF